ncbi:MAG TPA: tripartite tricarboxylate transporter TctB family protein [Burkholderiales bacterium]|nr:tripartite tricarboxylate transporter TctB family protein [Burkholderiales bacterium]
MLGRDGIAGLVCLVVSAGLLVLTLGLPPASVVPIGPAFYPRVVLLVLALLSTILIVLDLRATRSLRTAAPEGAAAAAAGPAPNYGLVLATFIEFGLYIALLPPLGFRISTFLFVLALQVTLEWPRSATRWALAVGVAIATSAVAFLVFQDYLSVLLPRGTWSGL